MAKRVPTRRIILWIVTALVLVFIFGQSILPEDLSAEESGWFRTHIMEPLFGFVGLPTPSHQLVRKMAHVFEFAVLSALLMFCFRGKLLRCAFTAFTAAFLDESLQLLTARGAQIQDVWVDLIGVALGTLIGFLLYKTAQRKHHRPTS